MERPKEVIDALRYGDQKALSAMGKKGGEHAALNRVLQKTRTAEEFAERALQSNEQISEEGDVLPLDPAVAETLKDEPRG